MWTEIVGLFGVIFFYLLVFLAALGVSFFVTNRLLSRCKKRSIRVTVINKCGTRHSLTLNKGESAEVDALIDKLKNRRHERLKDAGL